MTSSDSTTSAQQFDQTDGDLEDKKSDFLLKWCEFFPDSKIPVINFFDSDEVELRLGSCRSLIQGLERRLKQEKFYLRFLQTYLVERKKASFRESQKLNSNHSSASIERNPLLSTCLVDSSADFQQKRDLLNGETDTNVDDFGTAPYSYPIDVTMRPNCNSNSSKSSRISSVPENTKRFEARSDSSDSSNNAGENETSTKSSNKKSYIEVWECSTGPAILKPSKPPVKEDHTLPVMEVNEVFQNPAKAKPLVPHRRMRHDYEEVWTCSTGDKRVQLNSAEDHHTGGKPSTRNLSIEEYIEELENQQDILKLQENLKPDSPKPKMRNKAARNQPVRNRHCWRVALPPFQEDEQYGQQERYPTGFDSDGHSKSSDEEDNDYPSRQPTIPQSLRETSPLLRMRRAQTTNERMSVAYSAFQEWSDEESPRRHHSPLYSNRSTELQSSDDEGVNTPSKEGEPPPLPKKPVQSHYKDIPRQRNSAFLVSNDTASIESGRTTVSTDGSVPDMSGSPQKEAVTQMVDYQKVRNIAEAEKLTMRIWVLNSLLDTEEAYLQYLDTLLLYMKPLKATIGTSQPVMSNQDFETLFYRVPDLHNLHAEFYATLKPRLDTWTADTTVGDLFKKLLSKLNLYSDYLNNYKRAQHVVEKCAKENIQFAQLIEKLKVQSRDMKGSAESISLVEVLYKPVERVMRTTLVLQDLLKYTPHRHPDYSVLREVLRQSQIFLDRINSTSTSAFRPRRVVASAVAAARLADRELLKHGFLVEVASDGSRKLRHCFLFSDLLLCAKPKNTAGVFHNKASYECKWYIPLADLSFQARKDSEVLPEITVTSEEELHDLSLQAQQLKHDILREQEKSSKEQKTSTDGYTQKTRKEERLRKKLAEVEARLVLASPDLPLKLYHMEGRSYMFLMSSDYERNEWTEAILQQQESCFKSFSLTAFEINSLLADCIKQRKLNNIESMLLREDEELLSGYLSVNVQTGHGFLTTCNPYCTLEVDSYGQFQTKAKTRACLNTKSPNWNEEFELDVDGAMTLRILCYDRAKETDAGSSNVEDVLIAKGKLPLCQKSVWEKGEWIKECILMDDITVCISVQFVARETSLQRLPSQKSNGVFGVKIETVTKRDNSGIPNVVRKCIAEVEKRGIEEVGIYRVSGVASEIQALKEAFDTYRKDVSTLLSEMDIHAVAGVLKLYFRELPEPLFTDTRYKNFIEAATLTDPETKQRTITRLLSDLPEANYKTLSFLRQHIVKVALNSSVNKMTLHNLATVFGPTLLRPAEEKTPKNEQNLSQATMMLNALRLDIHSQMDILMYCLQMDMPDYDVLKRSLSREDTAVLSQNLSDISLVLPSDPEGSKNPKSPSAKPVSPQPRFHPYEEIVIAPKRSAKPQIAPPATKPRTNKINQENERDTLDYYSTDL